MLVTTRSWQFLLLGAKELFRREDGASLCNSTSLPLSLSLSFHCIYLFLHVYCYYLFYATYHTSKIREEDEAPLRWSVTSSPAGLFISQFFIFFFPFLYTHKKRGGYSLVFCRKHKLWTRDGAAPPSFYPFPRFLWLFIRIFFQSDIGRFSSDKAALSR
jgi:hypothetical protein